MTEYKYRTLWLTIQAWWCGTVYITMCVEPAGDALPLTGNIATRLQRGHIQNLPTALLSCGSSRFSVNNDAPSNHRFFATNTDGKTVKLYNRNSHTYSCQHLMSVDVDGHSVQVKSSQKSKLALLSMLQYVQDIQRIEILFLSIHTMSVKKKQK